jgi:O-antigen biosynthesis protein
MLTLLPPIKVIDLELSCPLTDIENLDGYMGVLGLVRLHGRPIGYVEAPILAGRCTATTLSQLIVNNHSCQIVSCLLQNGLSKLSENTTLQLNDLFEIPPPQSSSLFPLVTVAVCTRDRPSDLALCLGALNQLDYPNLDVLIVDNAPTNQATHDLITAHYPQFRYACEPRPGLNWARNRAILEAKGSIIAYTDDDVIVDPGWVRALAQVFTENPEVMAVTGLVVPYELETDAQIWFEQYGGFGRGFQRQWYRVAPGQRVPWQLLGTGRFGTGANMAYRRCVFEEIGYFDPALDVGTVTNGGGDLEMYFRILKAEHTLVYEPAAIIRHRHRRNYPTLRTQIENNGIGLYAYFTSGAIAYPDQRLTFLQIGIWWVWWWHLRRLILSWVHPHRFPRDLIWAEIQGVCKSVGRYQQARRDANAIAHPFSESPPIPQFQRQLFQRATQLTVATSPDAVALRTVELSQALPSLTDVTSYRLTRILLAWKAMPVGYIEIQNTYQAISTARLLDEVWQALGFRVLAKAWNLSEEATWATVIAGLGQRYMPHAAPSALTATFEQLAVDTPVSIVVATCDRPDDLRKCLQCLTAQISPRPIEIIVVDNRPTSGKTAPIVADFPSVTLIQETRRGLSYARNAGINASSGAIIVATDDDVTMPSHWLETLIAPFARPDVMVVTGNILPAELETSAQSLFEEYGGLGRGFASREVNGHWFEDCSYRTVPTWDLGATANAAFRATLFREEAIGLLDEALGVGTPTGCSEDTYVFYKVLKKGYTILYEPSAYVWHTHRREMNALRHQIYSYSKGHVAYQLTTLIEDRDFRVLARLLVGLPLVHAYRIYSRLRGWSQYPISFTLLEIGGNLAGPWALWRSRQRVKREGCSYFNTSLHSAQLSPSSLGSVHPSVSKNTSSGQLSPGRS